MENFIDGNCQAIECKSCGNNEYSKFKRKGADYVCGCCGRWYRLKHSDEEVDCRIAYNDLNSYEFDKARDAFERILEKHPDSIDALWGYLLAEYRIVYIKGFYKNVVEPTYCFDKYEMQKTRFFTNEIEYQKILELLKDDVALRSVYKEKARKIDESIANFKKCKDRIDNDVFICVKISAATEKHPDKKGYTKDFEVAEKLFNILKKRGIRPFFSFDTLKNQVDSDDLIWMNLVKSKKMVLICSRKDYAESAWVKSEWKRWLFLDRMKDLYILVLPDGNQSAFDILPKEFSGNQHYTIETSKKLIEDL
jgi:tetratricopeptide (TPR) repeat protein